MDDIIRQVVERTGIPEDKARMAVHVVLGQVEQRLPAPIAAQLRAHLGGGAAGDAGGPGGSGLGGIARGLGGMLGK